jgi:hypothetical protein
MKLAKTPTKSVTHLTRCVCNTGRPAGSLVSVVLWQTLYAAGPGVAANSPPHLVVQGFIHFFVLKGTCIYF